MVPSSRDSLERISREVSDCRACPRLVEWREEVAEKKRRMYMDWTYWGRGVPGFGDPRARLLIVGLAPAAHGANRTGRMFTGDRSGDFLYAGLHRAGFANQGTSVHKDDGLALKDVYITAPARCAPPANWPEPEELANCAPFLHRELALLPIEGVLALGAVGWGAVLRLFEQLGASLPKPKPVFGHGAVAELPGMPWLLGCFHVSQQNTQTGRLTPAMFDEVMAEAHRRLGRAKSSGRGKIKRPQSGS